MEKNIDLTKEEIRDKKYEDQFQRELSKIEKQFEILKPVEREYYIDEKFLKCVRADFSDFIKIIKKVDEKYATNFEH